MGRFDGVPGDSIICAVRGSWEGGLSIVRYRGWGSESSLHGFHTLFELLCPGVGRLATSKPLVEGGSGGDLWIWDLL